MANWATEPRFLEDVKGHKIQVLRDDGANRHIRFSRPDSGSYRFDLITWPWHLCYTGDMGTFVFSRINDMFEFFRCKPDCASNSLCINQSYWAEKALAVDRGEGLREYDEESFRRAVISWWKDVCREAINDGRMDKEGCAELLEALKDEVLCHADNGEIRARDAADGFSCVVQGRTFEMLDFCEHDFQEYTGRFTWACYAIAWGIQQYDAHKKAQAEMNAKPTCGDCANCVDRQGPSGKCRGKAPSIVSVALGSLFVALERSAVGCDCFERKP